MIVRGRAVWHALAQDHVSYLGQGYRLGLSQREAAVYEEGAAIGNGVQATGGVLYIGHGQGAWSQHGIVGQLCGKEFRFYSSIRLVSGPLRPVVLKTSLSAGVVNRYR